MMDGHIDYCIDGFIINLVGKLLNLMILFVQFLKLSNF